MIEVTCAIVMKEGKVLVTQRSENMRLPLKWEFPGGKIEENETAEDCLKRELKEELNIEVEIQQRLTSVLYDYGTFSISLIPFIADYISGDIILAEHKEHRWLQKNELKNLDWAAADIPILEEFLKANL